MTTDFVAYAVQAVPRLDRLDRATFAADDVRVVSPRLDPAAVEEIVGQLALRTDPLRARSASEVVRVLGRVGARFSREGDAMRERALALLPATAAVSRPMARAVLDGMARDWTEDALLGMLEADLGSIEALDRFTTCRGRRARAYGPELCVQVVAGSVPGVGVHAMLRSLVVKSPTLLKPGRGDVVLPVLFAEALRDEDPELAEALAVVYWPGGSEALERAATAPADVVVAYGSDETVAALRAMCRPETRFVGYHHRLSVGVVGTSALTEESMDETAEAIARAAALFDQRGCVSPHTIFVEDGGALGPGDLVDRLGAAFGRLERTLPSGALDIGEAAALQQLRGTAELLAVAGSGSIEHGGAESPWTVMLQDRGAPAVQADLPAAVGRVVRVRGFTHVADVVSALAPVGDHLQTAGLAGFGARTEEVAAALAGVGVTRVTTFEDVPFPQPSWFHDGRPPVGELVRWVGWELGGSDDPGS